MSRRGTIRLDSKPFFDNIVIGDIEIVKADPTGNPRGAVPGTEGVDGGSGSRNSEGPDQRRPDAVRVGSRGEESGADDRLDRSGDPGLQGASDEQPGEGGLQENASAEGHTPTRGGTTRLTSKSFIHRASPGLLHLGEVADFIQSVWIVVGGHGHGPWHAHLTLAMLLGASIYVVIGFKDLVRLAISSLVQVLLALIDLLSCTGWLV